MTSLASTVDFNYKIGIELTMLPAKGRLSKDWYSASYERTRYKLFTEFKHYCMRNNVSEQAWRQVHLDPGVVECPSPILTSWRAAKKWYETIQEVNEAVGLTTFRKGHVAGGGHIHIGGMQPKQKINFMADVQARPYLAWAFLDPNDTRNARCLAFEPYVVESLASVADNITSQWTLDRKSSVVRLTNKTMEWRAFDSAADWEIQELQIAFIQRYVSLIKRQKYNVTPIQTFTKSMKSTWRYDYDKNEFYDPYVKSVDLCIKEFKEFIIETLELPWKSYEWLVDRNLRTRFEWNNLA